ncbi:MAG: molybdopterin biosynthesis protein [Nitrospirae bacterium]|nr:MAG: molybdopterin biosynthesis protein [Nitrospirota bacterium]
MKKIFLESLKLTEAYERIFDRLDRSGCCKLPAEMVKTTGSFGRVTAEAVFAKYSSPFYHSAAMDGYAVRSAGTFKAAETDPCLLKLGADAVYVDTGDPMPEGFNAVVMIEDVNVISDQSAVGSGQSNEEYIEIYQPAVPYQHVRTIGEDIVATELIVPENHRIRAIDVGAMLASGNVDVWVRRRPVITVIPTGTEMIDAESVSSRPPKPPEIIEYNSSVLSGLAAELGADVRRSTIVSDDLDKISKAVGEAVEISDVVIVNAGSGKGTEDYTAQVIAGLGEVIIHSVAIKPGKPFIAGLVKGKPVFGIPGYPVSAYLTFRLFVKPVLEMLSGLSPSVSEDITAVISRQISSPLGVDEFVRVKVGSVNDKLIATPVGRGAGLMMSLVRADGIMNIPADSEGLSSGSEVKIDLLRGRDEIKNTVVCIGSHDNALDILSNSLKKNYPLYSLSSAHVGSMGGLIALKRGEAHMAGTHLLDEDSGEYNVPFIKKLLADRKVALVNLVYRQQGLLVKKGNAKRINGFSDLVRDDVVFINRQSGSGTRLLLDKHLKDMGIAPADVKGYEHEEYTHMAVASAVLTGLADTGLAVYSSAAALGLDFIPVANERYDLAIPAEFLETDMIKALLKIIREDKGFRNTVVSMGGYDISDMGRVVFGSL